jgi:hypothetical protein
VALKAAVDFWSSPSTEGKITPSGVVATAEVFLKFLEPSEEGFE